MRVLIIGSGGREHALTWKLKKSEKVSEIFVAPGNGGTAKCATNIPIKEDNIQELVKFVKEYSIDLVIPGPELPLTLGISDAMKAIGVACFGPSQWCSQLEGSKAFAKKLMVQLGIPTANYGIFHSIDEARDFIKNTGTPIVIKVDGLASGKGVFVSHTEEDALKALEYIMDKKVFGESGSTIVIEEFLEGEEVSLLAFCSADAVLPLPSVQDHKAAFDGDIGPNTGGMGVYSPAPCLPKGMLEEMSNLTILPIVREMSSQGHPYVGILYAGLMITKDGPKVLEYNIRFGDPECQVLMMRLESDLITLIESCLTGSLSDINLKVHPGSALGVVVVADGYPDTYPKGMLIEGIEKVKEQKGIEVFHSGTQLNNGQLYSNGGRILCVTSSSSALLKAQQDVYQAIKMIHIEKSRYRTDIGLKGLRYKNEIC